MFFLLIPLLLPATDGKKSLPFALSVDFGDASGRYIEGAFLEVGLQYRFQGKWGLCFFFATYGQQNYHSKSEDYEMFQSFACQRFGLSLYRIFAMANTASFFIEAGINGLRRQENSLEYHIFEGDPVTIFRENRWSGKAWSFGLGFEIQLRRSLAIRLRGLGLSNLFLMSKDEEGYFDVCLAGGLLCRF
jgi:hypothetical protein